MSHERPAPRGNEWDDTPYEEMTFWQKLAYRTNGWLTPPNATSALGGVLVTAGMVEFARDNYIGSVALVGSGRLCDLADGWLAKLMKIRGEKGALVDASIDKAVGAIALGTLAWTGDVPLLAAGAIALEQGYIIKQNANIHKLGGKVTPNLYGKLTATAISAMAIAEVGSKAAEFGGYEPLAKTLAVLGTIATGAAIAFGGMANWLYDKQERALQRAHDASDFGKGSHKYN